MSSGPQLCVAVGRRAIDALARVTSRPDDPADAVARKRLVLKALCLSVSVIALTLFIKLMSGNGMTIGTVGAIGGLSTNLLAFLYMALRKGPVGNDIYGTLCAAAVLTICLCDLEAAVTQRLRVWAALILVLDVLLMCNAPAAHSNAVITTGVLWLLLTEAEATFRYGLYDLPFLPSYEARTARCACAAPPCETGQGPVNSVFVALLVYLGDFFVTRGFATRMQRQKAAVEDAVRVARLVVRSLAEYDLAQAEAILHQHNPSAGNLPEALHDAFLDLLSNLQKYRPFLPPILFGASGQSASDPSPWEPLSTRSFPVGAAASSLARVDSVCRSFTALSPLPQQSPSDELVPPGLDGEPAAICFTDIKGSTRLWEACPVAMDAALQLHDVHCRREARARAGYEVKTVGDSFMLAFPTALAALRFGVAFNFSLLGAPWPRDILDMPACRPDGRLWAGLHVRVGVCFGLMAVRQHVTTGRHDYFGPVVNKAARLESISGVGLVATDADSVCRETRARLEEDGVLVLDRGLQELRGFQDAVQVYCVVDAALEDRIAKGGALDAAVEMESVVGPSPFAAAAPSIVIPTSVFRGCPEACIARVAFDIGREAGGEQRLQACLSTAIMCVQRCAGVVVSLDGATLTVAWGLQAEPHSKTRDIFLSSVQFVTLLRRQLDPAAIGGEEVASVSTVTTSFSRVVPPPPGGALGFCVVITSGPLHYGFLGTAATQLVSVIGPPLDLAHALLGTAQGMHLPSVTASLPPGTGHAVHPVLRDILDPLPHGLPGRLGEAVVHQLVEPRAAGMWSDKTVFQQMDAWEDAEASTRSQTSQRPQRDGTVTPGQNTLLQSVGEASSLIWDARVPEFLDLE